MEDKIWTDIEFFLLTEEQKTGIFKFDDGTVIYLKKGKHHRDDGPAIEYATGSKHWYKEGNLHRDDGPAIEYATGSKHWYKEGKLHRDDGPAIEYGTGDRSWYKYGKLHCLDGPAIEFVNGEVGVFYIENTKYTEEEWKKLSFAILNNLEVFL